MTVSSLFVFLLAQLLRLLVKACQIGENLTLGFLVAEGALVLAGGYVISIIYGYRDKVLPLAFHVWLHEAWYLEDLVLAYIFEMGQSWGLFFNATNLFAIYFHEAGRYGLRL